MQVRLSYGFGRSDTDYPSGTEEVLPPVGLSLNFQKPACQSPNIKGQDPAGNRSGKSMHLPARGLHLFRPRDKPATPDHQESEQENSRVRLEALLAELGSLVGLLTIKSLIQENLAFAEIQRLRAREELATSPVVLHMVFKGNPGTGKTTVARILAILFKEMGFLSKGQLVEVERADLVGEYIGHTAQKTREQVKKALGGVLFIDEAYSLARGGNKDFGRESIDTLVRAMEENRENFVLILAGYTREMNQFLATNPGLVSRFPLQIEFPDYTLEELLAIGNLMLEQRQYFLTPQARAELEHKLRRYFLHGQVATGNARLVRNIIETALRRQAMRLVGKAYVSREELMAITKEDIVFEDPPPVRQPWNWDEESPSLRQSFPYINPTVWK